MQKIRRCLAIIVLLATLGGSALSGVGLAASVVSSRYAGSSVASGRVAGAGAITPTPPGWCPGTGTYDC